MKQKYSSNSKCWHHYYSLLALSFTSHAVTEVYYWVRDKLEPDAFRKLVFENCDFVLITESSRKKISNWFAVVFFNMDKTKKSGILFEDLLSILRPARLINGTIYLSSQASGPFTSFINRVKEVKKRHLSARSCWSSATPTSVADGRRVIANGVTHSARAHGASLVI